jgi:hypothetical protein
MLRLRNDQGESVHQFPSLAAITPDACVKGLGELQVSRQPGCQECDWWVVYEEHYGNRESILPKSHTILIALGEIDKGL